jgi:hypothetical protein
MELLFALSTLVMLAVSAWYGGVDSREGVDSCEWQRLQHWSGFGHGR